MTLVGDILYGDDDQMLRHAGGIAELHIYIQYIHTEYGYINSYGEGDSNYGYTVNLNYRISIYSALCLLNCLVFFLKIIFSHGRVYTVWSEQNRTCPGQTVRSRTVRSEIYIEMLSIHW